LEDDSLLKIGHNLSPFLYACAEEGIHPQAFDDMALMAYVLYGTEVAHDLPKLVEQCLEHEASNLENDELQGIQNALSLHQALQKTLLQERLMRVYQMLERPLLPVIVAMERAGIFLDVAELKTLSLKLQEKLEALTQKIFEDAGETFNIASPQQLAHILFEKKGLKGGKKGKSGVQSTAVNVLEALSAEGHTIADNLLAWRALSKLQNTYTDALPSSVDARTQRIHTTFLMAATSTGRLASRDPNLQNIPIRSPEGREIRAAFKPAPGSLFLSCDYSQIELRFLAHMGHVEPLIASFKEGADIHTRTASEIFNTPIEEVSPLQRRQAKMINFGIIYGISAFGLGERLTMDPKIAKQHIETYLERYAGIRDYMERTKEEARRHGYVTTLWGRRCYIPQIRSHNFVARQAAERQAINAPLQGSSADLMRLAMIRIHNFLKAEGWPCRLLLQVHDELLFEGPEKVLTQYRPTFEKLMVADANLCIPLTITSTLKKTW
jgi:DNA polymerase-1